MASCNYHVYFNLLQLNFMGCGSSWSMMLESNKRYLYSRKMFYNYCGMIASLTNLLLPSLRSPVPKG